MIAATVWELSAGNIDDALTGTGRYLMNEAYQVLIGIAEAHASADTTLEEACGTGHAEGNHALILVPNVHHAVELVVSALHGEDVQQVIPVLVEFSKGCIHFSVVSNLAISSCAFSLLITFLATNFLSCSFSTYPKRKIRSRLSPGCRVTSI